MKMNAETTASTVNCNLPERRSHEQSYDHGRLSGAPYSMIVWREHMELRDIEETSC